jgi:hypothetical protein
MARELTKTELEEIKAKKLEAVKKGKLIKK